ncbi:inactive protein RESTRICTED TEV MOVEMENT 2 [Sesamum indicum]|uniref:Inactive protein RESTRICTED TEV MOVEMENT 2 n=1 Tax=Sesamum indicum TaxID=4182 RepID=A0A6I9TIB3_SESIN|nr:inactive protein RESTRICTED TEV MOVEMENT 2 [Sesamum indicum]
MDASAGAAASATNSFEPSSDLIHEEECDTLLLYLPGFTKEQLRVQLTRSGILKISGIRPVGDNKWSSFQKDFPVSANCDTNKISAKFEGGILYVRQPKLIVPADKEDNKTPPPQPQQTTTPTNEPPPAQKIDQAPKHDEQSKQTSTNKEAADHSQESAQIKDAKPTKEKEKEKAAATTSANDKYERTAAQADAPQLGNKTTNGGGVAKADEHKLSAGSPAAKLRTARQTVMMILAVVFAFGLGIYISRMNWFSGKAE